MSAAFWDSAASDAGALERAVRPSFGPLGVDSAVRSGNDRQVLLTADVPTVIRHHAPASPAAAVLRRAALQLSTSNGARRSWPRAASGTATSDPRARAQGAGAGA